MNARTRILVTLAAFVLTFGSIPIKHSASAQSTNNCMKVKGKFVDLTTGPETSSGTVTNGGILNGAEETVYDLASGVLTYDPTTVTFTGDTTWTTNRGVLKTHNIFMLDFARGVGAALYRIDPSTSTGIFAGATGVLFINAYAPDPIIAFGDISGEICFAP